MKSLFLLAVLGASCAFGVNVLPNPSFETWVGTLPLGWLTSEPLFPGSAVRDSASHTGVYCVKLVGGDTSAFMSSAALVQPGRHYDFAAFARAPGVLGGSFLLQFLRLSGGAIGTPEVIPIYYSGEDYREYTRWVTAPESASFLSVSCATLPNVTAYIDDVTLDDTTLSVVEERPGVALRLTPKPRKAVMVGGMAVQLERSAQVFDVLGRRQSRPVSGVLFLRRDD